MSGPSGSVTSGETGTSPGSSMRRTPAIPGRPGGDASTPLAFAPAPFPGASSTGRRERLPSRPSPRSLPRAGAPGVERGVRPAGPLSSRRAADRRAGGSLPPGGPESAVLQLAQSVHVRDGGGVRAGVRGPPRRRGRRRSAGTRRSSTSSGRLVTALFGTATLAVLYVTGRLAYGPRSGSWRLDSWRSISSTSAILTGSPRTCRSPSSSRSRTFLALRYWRDRTPLRRMRRRAGGRPGDLHEVSGRARLPRDCWRPMPPGGRPGRPGAASWGETPSRRPAWPPAASSWGRRYALLTPVAFVRGVLDELREVNTVQFGNEADAPGYLFHLAYSLPEAMGWPLYLLALAGLGWALARRAAREAILLAFADAVSARDRQLELPLRALRDPTPAEPHAAGGGGLARVVAWVSARARLARTWPAHRAGGAARAARRAFARASDRLSPAARAAGHARARRRLDRAPRAAGDADRARAVQPDAARCSRAAPRGAGQRRALAAGSVPGGRDARSPLGR